MAHDQDAGALITGWRHPGAGLAKTVDGDPLVVARRERGRIVAASWILVQGTARTRLHGRISDREAGEVPASIDREFVKAVALEVDKVFRLFLDAGPGSKLTHL